MPIDDHITKLPPQKGISAFLSSVISKARKFLVDITGKEWVLIVVGILTWALLLSPLPFAFRWIGLFFAFANFALLASTDQKEYGNELLRYLFEAALAAGLAWGLVVVLSEGTGAIPAEHIAVGAALAIVLSGISTFAKSARAMGEAEQKFNDGAANMKTVVEGAQNASQKTDEAADRVTEVANDLTETVDQFKQEVDRAHLVSLAARAVMLRSDTMAYKPVQNAVGAALGTIRTWAQSSRRGFDGDNLTKGKCSPSEATWWRCLESYHNEERYDLARFELVTNTRNYTYILNSILDEMRSSVGLLPNRRGRITQGKNEVVIVQCSTFAPKDFYNFPVGPKGSRTYRDYEFYGTYRRSVSFMNRQVGMLPHRIVFVADDEGTKKDKEKTENRLERLGWMIDTPAETALSCARLYCAPYAMPIDGVDQDGGPYRLFERGWAPEEAEGDDPPEGGKRTGYGKFQICPVAAMATPWGDDNDKFAWALRAREYCTRVLYGKTYEDLTADEQKEVNALLKRSPQDLALADPINFLLRRENWAWEEVVKPASAEAQGPDLTEDSQALHDAFIDLKASREEMIKHVADFSTPGCEAKLTGLVRELVPRSQGFDAAYAELRSSMAGQKGDATSRWKNLQSMTGLQMGAGELWLYHALNYINAILFKVVAGERRMVPIWDLFCWDFLGMSEAKIADGAHMRWASEQGGAGSRIRFVKVKPGELGDTDEHVANGVLSACAFDKKGYQREFTLVGVRPRSDNDRPSLEGVTWTLLLTNEMAPPYSTCRLNFSFDHSSGPGEATLLKKYSDWVERAWKQSEGTSQDIFKSIKKELEDHNLAKAAE